jgi:hypothetical protein
LSIDFINRTIKLNALTHIFIELAALRAQNAMLRDRCAALDAAAQELEAQLHAAIAERAAVERTHAHALADVQPRYEALSKQLQQETAHQREPLKKERARSVAVEAAIAVRAPHLACNAITVAVETISIVGSPQRTTIPLKDCRRH